MKVLDSKDPFDIHLKDGQSKQEWKLKLLGRAQRSAVTEDQFALYIRNVGKQLGGFDEQRDWRGGRGGEFLSEDPSRYFDGQNAWTVNGQIHPTLQWKWATGYRVVDQVLPGSVSFLPIYVNAGQSYASVSFSAGANNTTDKCWLIIRRVGNPTDGTFALCPDSTGSPNYSGALKTKTVTTSNVTDLISVWWPFDFTGTQAIVSGTTYHIVFTGTGTVSDHWEIGINTSASGKTSTNGTDWTASTFSPYYRLTDADTARRWFFFTDGTNFWAVDKKDSGNSAVYSINSSAVCTEKTTTGLGTVTSRPIASNGYYYFPQGESTNIREYNGNATWADDGSNKATFLCNGYDSADGAVIWRANTTAGTTSSVSRAKVTTSGTDHTFGTAIPVGDLVGSINGIYFWSNNGLWVFKSDSVWEVLNDKAIYKDYGVNKTPSSLNGQASAAQGQFLFFNWLFSDERLFSGTVDDIGQGWRGPALPNGREGSTAKYETYVGWVFKAIDAGASGTSSVQIWDGLGFHEIFRAPYVGMRIRDLAIQVISGSRNRLWIDCGGDLIYMDLPLNKGNPQYDTSINYHWEGVITSSTIDMGTASRLPKFIRDLTATTKNLDGGGIRVEVEYQTDDDIGKDGIANWKRLSPMLSSPESIVNVLQPCTQFRYRLRLLTNSQTTPPIIKGILPSGFARSQFRWVWNMQIIVGQSLGPNGKAPNPEDLDRWLSDVAREPGRVKMESKWANMHDYYVAVSPATTHPISTGGVGQSAQTIYTLSLLEV